MYSRQGDVRHTNRVNIPANYGGSFFAPSADVGLPSPEEKPEETPAASSESQETLTPVGAAPTKEEHPTGLFGLFGKGNGGVGYEELLILGLALLISRNEAKDDLAFLLLLLLFVN